MVWIPLVLASLAVVIRLRGDRVRADMRVKMAPRKREDSPAAEREIKDITPFVTDRRRLGNNWERRKTPRGLEYNPAPPPNCGVV